MRYATLAAALAAGILVAGSAGAQAPQSRTALVIGNAAYREAPLKNPVNDARAMAARLKELGFEVIAREDVTRAQMAQVVLDFAGKLKQGGEAVFYYAGHGIQARGRNYLIPVDADIQNESAVQFAALDVGAVLAEMEQSGSRVSLAILDACRNNPFERRLRGASRGLAAIDAARGSVIAYATAPGSVASDGDGANGLYTSALLKALAEPGLKVEEVFKRARAEVAQQTRGQQTPWESSSLVGDFILNLTVTVAPAVTTASPADRDALFWYSIQSSPRAGDFEAYLAQFPNGTFAALARIRLEELRKPQIAAVPPKPDLQIEPIDKPYAATGAARLREAPDLKSAVVATLKEGEQVHVLGKVKGQNWYQVEQKGKPPAYVASSLLTDATRVAATAIPSPGASPSPATPAVGVFPQTPGQSFKDCADCPEMVVVPPGSTTMGEGGFATSFGTNRVTIPRAFAVGKYEVTFAEWDACLAAGGCSRRPDDRGWGRGRQPVMNVMRDDAKQYTGWLSRKSGKSYRLLSEAEWEYAARGGRGGDVGGKAELKGRNLANCGGCGSRWDNKQTAPVGSFGPNGFGLHDMLGNVWEWVEDCWNATYAGAPTDGRPWLGGDCRRRVLRGGSWLSDSGFSHASGRGGDDSVRYFDVGFRVARTN